MEKPQIIIYPVAVEILMGAKIPNRQIRNFKMILRKIILLIRIDPK